MKIPSQNRTVLKGSLTSAISLTALSIALQISFASPPIATSPGTPASEIAATSPPSELEPAAAYELGLQHFHGRGVPRNAEKAYPFILSAAERGHANALCLLGHYYSAGLVVEKDEARARRYFESGNEKGSLAARVNLGRFLIHGRGGEKNAARGIELLEDAARQGSLDASLTLGEVFYFGEHRDGEPDYPRAFAVLKSPAERGHPQAQNMIGVMTRDGRIPGVDRAAARDWFLKAARQGHAKACLNLGYDYGAKDRAVRVESMKWLLVAKELKEVAAMYLWDDWGKTFKEDEVQEAQVLADEVIASLRKK